MITLKNQSPKVLVVGDLMIDVYLWGHAGRVSPEAPVLVVDVDKTNTVLGGAGNVINNLLALGSQVFVGGVIGDDQTAIELNDMLIASGANTTALITQKSRKTSKKTRVMASHQQIVRFDSESREPIESQSETKLKEAVSDLLAIVDICLLSDYGKGVLTPTLTQYIINEAKRHNKKVLIDPKGSDYSKYKNATLITPNRKEAGEAVGATLGTIEAVKEAGEKLRKTLALEYAIITLSEAGMMICDQFGSTHIPTQAREVYDVTGAGDTVLSSLGFALACSKTIDEAAHFANIAAAVVVSKLGSATATIDEAIAYEFRHSINQSANKVLSLREMAHEAERVRASGRKIVFTNGCFDLLHRGHIEYLQKSRAEGDVLIVGLNSDKSVKALKGESRPIVCQEDRAFMLATLGFVDFVVLFDDLTPIELVRAIRPDVLTKGADYANKEVVGREFAGRVALIDFVDGRSTTSTISKIAKDQVC
ncbi:bifunctional protein HldE [Campylobacterota bacterium]|nr:bifunctional protein HldE [Campylobacterota bacterium]